MTRLLGALRHRTLTNFPLSLGAELAAKIAGNPWPWLGLPDLGRSTRGYRGSVPRAVTGGGAIAGVKCLPQVLVSGCRLVEQPMVSVHCDRSRAGFPDRSIGGAQCFATR